MALESPLKKELDKASISLDHLQRLYNVYFQGGEEDPPRKERKDLDTLIGEIKSKAVVASNTADKFRANALVARYQSLTNKWDKHLRAIDNGILPRPKKRK